MPERRLVTRFLVPKETGRAFIIAKDQVLRIVEVEGPQTCDFNCWNADNLKEAFSAGRTRFFTGIHPRKGDSLWSKPPYDRRMLTIIEDTVAHVRGPLGEASHDLEFPRCSPIVFEYPFGRSNVSSCQQNMARAIAEHGLAPEDVHDSCNFFMRTGVDASGHIFIAQPDSVKGDYVELLFHLKCLVAISVCPAGNIHATQDLNRPLQFEIYEAAG